MKRKLFIKRFMLALAVLALACGAAAAQEAETPNTTVTEPAQAAPAKEAESPDNGGTGSTQAVPAREDESPNTNGTDATQEAPAQEDESQNTNGTDATQAAPAQEKVIREATCGEAGTKEVTDASGAVKEVTIPATGNHTWGDWQAVKEATCAGKGERSRTCSTCGKTETEKIPATDDHSWGEWETAKEATCTSDGKRTRTCSTCGKTESEAIPKVDHSWGEWETVKEPTCTYEGKQKRTCESCGKTQNQSVSPLDHKWSAWKIIREAGCTENGKQQHTCERCDKQESVTIPKTGHIPGEWTVTEEPTCRKGGKRETTCTACGTVIREKLGRTDHAFDEWETVKEPTEFTRGKERSSCRYCGKKETRDFYPEGTLARDLENDPGKVKELQELLSGMSLYSGEASGEFDKDTATAVKKLQKSLKQKTDGVAWPGLLRMLGLYGNLGEPVTDDVGEYKLQLAVKQVSPAQERYAAGDELDYEWTLTNASQRNAAKDLKLYSFGGLMPQKKTDLEAGTISDVERGESASGTYTYTVTEEDVLSGRFTFGFIVRGRLGGSKVESNKVCFVNAAEAGGIAGRISDSALE